MQQLIDKVLGRYKLVEYLGGGADGHLFRGVQVGLEREVAVRVLTEEQAQDARTLSRFRQESRATAQLSHPHILTVYDSGKESGLRFAVTELLDPRSLSDHVRAGKLPVKRAVEIGVELAQALEYIHQRGIVHAHIFPSQVRFDRRNATILAGFGVEEAERLSRATEENAQAYCPPELLLGEEVGPAGDIYQLGAVLYEATTGRRPYPGRPPFVSGGSGYEVAIESVKKLTPDAPESLDELLLACLRADPAERPADAGKVRQGLGRALRKLEVRAVSRQVNKKSSKALSVSDVAPTRAVDQRSVAAAAAGAQSSVQSNPLLEMLTGGHGDLSERETQIRLGLVVLPALLVLTLLGLYASGILGGSPPQVLELVHRAGARTLEVSWRTDRPGHGALEARPADRGEAWSRIETSGEPARRHTLKLAGLEPATRYEFRLVTGDLPGVPSGEPGAPREATTAEALEIRDIQVVSRSETSILLSWETTVPAQARLRYRRAGESRATSRAPIPAESTEHRFELKNLHPDSAYTLEPIAFDPDGEVPEVVGQATVVRTRPKQRHRSSLEATLGAYAAKLRRLSSAELSKLERSLQDVLGAERPLDGEQKVLLTMTRTQDASGFFRRRSLAERWAAQQEEAGLPAPPLPAWSKAHDFAGTLDYLKRLYEASSEALAMRRLDECIRALAANEGLEVDGS